jgi:hypothetical protein
VIAVAGISAALLAAAVPPAATSAAATAADSPAGAAGAAYADLVDLALAAPVVVQVRTVESIAVNDAEAPGLRPGFARLYLQAEVTALLRAPAPVPSRVAWLADLPRDARGRPPRLAKGAEFLLFAATVPGRPGELRLVARDAQLPFAAGTAQRLRAILREASAPSPPPVVTGIGRAFHSPGNLPGESETQIFVQTADRRPVSLSILRRPGQAARWAVALSEVVDESATLPQPETLLWYRLACGLPRSVPARSLEDADAATAAAIRRDYQLVLDGLGACVRARQPG